jgi:hypothetical protein
MTRGYAGIIIASFLTAFMLLTALPWGVAAADVTPTYTFIEEGAEEVTFEEWNVRWQKYDSNSASSLDYWCRSQHNTHSGNFAAYCAKTGYNTHYLNSTNVQPFNMNITGLTQPYNPADAVLRYDTNMDALMRRDLDTNMTKFYNTITVTFWFYSDTGNSDAKQQGTNEGPGYDFLNLVYYTGTSDAVVRHVAWTNNEAQAKAKVWTEVTRIIPQNAIKIAFEFVSGTYVEGGDAADAFAAFGVRTVPQGSTGMKEGVYLDDITVVGSDPVEDGEMVTSVEPLSTYQTSRSFDVYWDDNGALYVPVQYSYLYYRVDGGQWTKFVNADKPKGGFLPDLPIAFTAPKDGTYEFFSQGYNGTLENWRGAADVTTIVDTSAPATSMLIMGNGEGDTYDGAVAFTLQSTDTGSGVNKTQYRLDGSDWRNYTGSVGLTSNGLHTIEYYAVDKAGNVEATKTSNITITNGAAGVVFQDKGKTYTTSNVTVNFAVVSSGTITKVEYSLDDGAYVALDASATSVALTDLADGGHKLVIRAEDSLGNVLVGENQFTVGQAETGAFLDDPMVLAGIGIVAIAAIGGVAYLVLRKRKK